MGAMDALWRVPGSTATQAYYALHLFFHSPPYKLIATLIVQSRIRRCQ